jgi:tetratricopeptide (TPR) repeat protein
MTSGERDTLDSKVMQRLEAARLLRAARSGDAAARAEAIDWLFAACGERRAPRRLKVATLIADGHHDAARAVIAQGLLRDPADTVLLRLKAESLLAEGRPREADRAIRGPLERWPRHLRTLRLAARIATAAGDPERAVTLLRRAETERPDDQAVRAELVQALLDASRPDEAAVAIDLIDSPTPVLAARVLGSRGRMLEAVDVLERAHRRSASEEALCELIGLLEATGNFPRLRRLLERISTDEPLALVRAGVAWLTLGSFRTAADRMAPLRESAPHQRTALSVLVVASAMLGRSGLAEKAFLRLQQTPAGADASLMAGACGGPRGGRHRTASGPVPGGDGPHRRGLPRPRAVPRHPAAAHDPLRAGARRGPPKGRLRPSRGLLTA